MPCATCSKYVADTIRSHGFAIHRLSDFWKSDDGWPELDSVPADTLLDVVADGLPIGRLAEIPTKWFLLTTKITEDPIGPSTTRAFLRSTRQVARSMRRVLDEVSPDVVVVLNGLFLFEAVTIALCRERAIDVVNYNAASSERRCSSRARAWPASVTSPMCGRVSATSPSPTTRSKNSKASLKDRSFGRRSIEQYWRDVRFDTIPRRTSGSA